MASSFFLKPSTIRSDRVFFPDLKVETFEILDVIARITGLHSELVAVIYRYFLSLVPHLRSFEDGFILRSPENNFYILKSPSGKTVPLLPKITEGFDVIQNLVALSSHHLIYGGNVGRRWIHRPRGGLEMNMGFIAKTGDGKVVTWDILHGVGPFHLKIHTDQENRIITDTRTVAVTMYHGFAILTYGGDLYVDTPYSYKLIARGVRSVFSNYHGFAAIYNEGEPYEYHTYFEVEEMNILPPYDYPMVFKRNGGQRNLDLPEVHPSTTCVATRYAFAFLLKSGRVEIECPLEFRGGYRLPDELKHRLLPVSNYVRSLVASSSCFAVVLELSHGDREAYIWGENGMYFSSNETIYSNPDPSDGKKRKKEIFDVVASDSTDNIGDRKTDLSSVDCPSIDAFAINFEDGTSLLLVAYMKRRYDIRETLPETRVRRISSTSHGILIVHQSGTIVWDLLSSTRRYISLYPTSIARSCGDHIISYSQGRYEVSRSSKPPASIRFKIKRAGGIAEICSNPYSYCAILMNGTVVTWV